MFIASAPDKKNLKNAGKWLFDTITVKNCFLAGHWWLICPIRSFSANLDVKCRNKWVRFLRTNPINNVFLHYYLYVLCPNVVA